MLTLTPLSTHAGNGDQNAVGKMSPVAAACMEKPALALVRLNAPNSGRIPVDCSLVCPRVRFPLSKYIHGNFFVNVGLTSKKKKKRLRILTGAQPPTAQLRSDLLIARRDGLYGVSVSATGEMMSCQTR